MFGRIPLSRTGIAFVFVAGLAALATACAARTTRDPGAQERQRLEQLRKHLRESVNLLQGTWVLQRRTNPDGRPHAQPLKGEMTINLSIDSSAAAAAAPRAVGAYTGFESGVLDAAFSDFGPGDVINPDPTAAGVMFEMNANSQLEMDMAMNSPATMTLTYRNLELKGTYGVFRQGIRSARLPTTYRKTEGSWFRGPSLSLVNEIGASDVQVPADARGPGSPTDKSHDIVGHVISGSRMQISYGNGGRDVWVRRQR